MSATLVAWPLRASLGEPNLTWLYGVMLRACFGAEFVALGCCEDKTACRLPIKQKMLSCRIWRQV